MSGKRKPSPDSPLNSSSPTSLVLSSSVSTFPFYSENDTSPNKSNPGPSFFKINQYKNKELTKSAKQQRPQKQKTLLATRSKTFDSSLIPTDIIGNSGVSSSSFDYENVHSPGSASNASSEGPTYVRTPGFEHHGQEFEIQKRRQQFSNSRSSFALGVDEEFDESGNVVDPVQTTEDSRNSSKGSQNTTITTKKKKSLSSPAAETRDVDIIKKTDPSQPTTKQKPKKEPLPMKLRALPQSFWQQPNHTNCLSPGAVYPVLPPLYTLGASKDDVESLAAGMRSSASPEEGQPPRREVSVANTDLLFSLFRGIEEEQTKVTVVRRGRPKKPPSTVFTRVLRDEDPCLVSTVTESILPLIPDRMGSGNHGTRFAQGQQVLAMVSLKDGDKSLSLPSLNVEHNYSRILSELVIKL